MKKIVLFVAALALIGMVFTSCSKNVEKCWEVTATISMEGMEPMTQTTFVWATQNDIDPMIEETKAEMDKQLTGTGATVTLTRSVSKQKTLEDCTDAAINAGK